MIRKPFSSYTSVVFFFTFGSLILKINPAYCIRQNIVSRTWMFLPQIIQFIQLTFCIPLLSHLQMSRWQALHSEISLYWPQILKRNHGSDDHFGVFLPRRLTLRMSQTIIKKPAVPLRASAFSNTSFLKTEVSGYYSITLVSFCLCQNNFWYPFILEDWVYLFLISVIWTGALFILKSTWWKAVECSHAL